MTAPAQPVEQSRASVTAAKLAALLALVQAQGQIRQQLTATATAAAVAAFDAVTDWWDGDQISRAVKTALKVVRPNQIQSARIADAYVARTASLLTGRNIRPVGTVDVTKLRRAIPAQVAKALLDGKLESPYVILGEHNPDHRRVVTTASIDEQVTMAVPDPAAPAGQKLGRRRTGGAEAQALDPGEAYGRVAEGYRYAVVAHGDTEDTARRKALLRVAAVAETDVTIAVRQQYLASMRGLTKLRDIRGYRRVLHPELSQTGPCGLCVVAADRVYHIEALLPLHLRCRCEVLPILGEQDPGIVLNNDDLQAIYEAAGGTGGEVVKDTPRGKVRHSAALKKVRVALAENGELGPVLVDADQHYRGPREVAKTVVPDRSVQVRAQLEALDKSFAVLKRRQFAGENVDKPLAYHERSIASLQRELASL